MAITQSRMLSLLSAAQDFEQAIIAAVSIIQVEYNKARAGHQTPDEALSIISSLVSISGLLSAPLLSPKVIAIEATHFTPSTQRRNDRVAAKQREHRLGSFAPTQRHPQRHGLMPGTLPGATTAPTSIRPIYQPPGQSLLAQAQADPDPSQPPQPGTPLYETWLRFSRHRQTPAPADTDHQPPTLVEMPDNFSDLSPSTNPFDDSPDISEDTSQ